MKIMKINIRETSKRLVNAIDKMGTFILLLMLYLTAKGLGRLSSWQHFPQLVQTKINAPLLSLCSKGVKLLDRKSAGTISRVELIELSIRNMKVKKTRTFVTIGGMMIGIGAIVFLVSIGYGLQQVVVTRVARLEEMKQADVSPQAGGKVKIDDKTLSDFKSISGVNTVLPLIAVVGRVNYKNSVSDIAVYGVTSDYLKQSAIKPTEGKIFDSNELTTQLPEAKGAVAGASTEKKTGSYSETIQDVDYMIDPTVWIRVRENPTTSAKILGYTKRVEGQPAGEEVWGGSYISDDNKGNSGQDENGKPLGKWVKARVLLWKEKKCDPEITGDCENGNYVVLRDENGQQEQEEGYFAEINLTVTGVNIREPEVLGLTTEVRATSLSNIDWVEIASEAGAVSQPETKTVDISSSAKKQAVVNRAVLQVLGIKESEAVGKTFSVSFVVVGDLLSDPKEKVESTPTEYTIVGVTPEEKTPFVFVPFIDLRMLGITNYSQVKVVAKDQSELSKIRRQIEALGYVTGSVADTVSQINSLFATLRTVFALLGMIALAVAALGMFNTLTVSLLERTREVGLMKAMGMKSSEVSELFLTESMVMGFFGGVLGIILGLVLGKILGIIISLFALFKGVGFIDVSYLPFSFVLVILFLSLFVGLVTGIYPAKRATKISALNALRYE